jgi:hypothetical protein
MKSAARLQLLTMTTFAAYLAIRRARSEQLLFAEAEVERSDRPLVLDLLEDGRLLEAKRTRVLESMRRRGRPHCECNAPGA